MTQVNQQSVQQEIANAYYTLSGNRRNVRVRLSDLRLTLKMDRATLDAELLQMERDGKLVLYPLDDPQEITAEDRAAEIRLIGCVRHIVYMG